MPHNVVGAALQLKEVRALLSSEQQLCNVAQSRLEESSATLQQLSREHLNLQHKLQALLTPLSPASGASLAAARSLCACPEPSVPPPSLRPLIGPFGALVALLRRSPQAFAAILDSGTLPPVVATQLLLCHSFRGLCSLEEERAFLRVAEALLALQLPRRSADLLFESGGLPAQLIASYLRVAPGSSGWLQAAIGATLERIVARSESSHFPAQTTAQTTAETSADASVIDGCERLLGDVLRTLVVAPLAVRALSAWLRRLPSGATTSEAVSVRDGAGGEVGGGAGETCAETLALELLCSLYLSPAVCAPTAYGLLLSLPLASLRARSSLERIGIALAEIGRGRVVGGRCAELASACARRLIRLPHAEPADMPMSDVSVSDMSISDMSTAEIRAGGMEPEGTPLTHALPPDTSPLEIPISHLEMPISQLRSLHALCFAQRARLLELVPWLAGVSLRAPVFFFHVSHSIRPHPILPIRHTR